MDEEYGKARGTGNGRYRKIVGFPEMSFGITLVVSFQLLPLVLGDQGCRRRDKGKKISGKKSKRRSIWIKFDLYEFCLYYIIY